MTTSTLDCYLSEGEHSLARQFAGSFQKHQSMGGKVLYVVIVTVRYTGEAYREVFREVLHSLDIGQIQNLVDAIRNAIYKGYGHAPEGLQIRSRGYLKGRSASPDIDCRRTLSFVDQNQSSHPHIALLEQHNTRLINLHQTTMQEMSATMAAQGTTIAALAESQASLATARTAGATSAEVASGGLNGIAALLAFLGLWPQIRDTFNIPKDMTVAQMANLLKHTVQTATQANPVQLPQQQAIAETFDVGPPPTIPGEEDEEVMTRPAASEEERDRAAFTRSLEAAKRQPEMLQSFVKDALADPVLKQAFFDAYMKSN